MTDCFKTIKKVTPKALTSYDLCRIILDIQCENKKQNIKIESLQKRVNVLYVVISILFVLVSGLGVVLALQ